MSDGLGEKGGGEKSGGRREVETVGVSLAVSYVVWIGSVVVLASSFA